MRYRYFLALVALAAALISSPLKAQDYADDADPIEGLNRAIFTFNQGVDYVLIRPVAWGYREVVPQYGRDRMGNFFTNLGEPVNFVNAALQGDLNQAFTTFWRFLINSTIGIAGLYDQASYMGLAYRNEDFGQTMGWYGAGEGFYLVLPILGPSSARDAIGMVADVFTSPLTYVEEESIPLGVAIAKGIHTRAAYLEITDNIDETAIDPYATYRSLYLQRRIDLIQNGQPSYGSERF